jgi:Bacterial pre-peptidase C-terminal domain
MTLVTRSSRRHGFTAHYFAPCHSAVLGLLATLVCSGAALAQTPLYNPIPLPSSNSLKDVLSEKDIPMGGGFARDYSVKLQAGDQVAIDLLSESFDPLVMLLSADGETIGENDDASEGGTDALLFVRITKTGSYTLRVRSFGESKGGSFSLKLTRLKPI